MTLCRALVGVGDFDPAHADEREKDQSAKKRAEKQPFWFEDHAVHSSKSEIADLRGRSLQTMPLNRDLVQGTR